MKKGLIILLLAILVSGPVIAQQDEQYMACLDAIAQETFSTLVELAYLSGQLAYLYLPPVSPPEEFMAVLVKVHEALTEMILYFDEWMRNIRRLLPQEAVSD